MNPKHTPGPWEIRWPFAWKVEIRNGERILGFIVANPRHAQEELGANATLIAAAPEMLEALREVSSVLKTFRECRISTAPKTESKVAAAIAKAVGGAE